MRAIWYDFIPGSDAPSHLKTPALADDGPANGLTITFPQAQTYDAIGVGNTDALSIIVNGETINLVQPDTNGLYMLPQEYTSTTVTISLSSEFNVGRIAVGKAHSTPIAPAREPGMRSTSAPRVTRSNQVIPGLGGVSMRTFSVDVRYKFTREIWDDIYAAFPTQLGQGFPIFVDFEKCDAMQNYPFSRLYAQPDDKFVFQSAARKFLYSKKINLTERF